MWLLATRLYHRRKLGLFNTLPYHGCASCSQRMNATNEAIPHDVIITERYQTKSYFCYQEKYLNLSPIIPPWGTQNSCQSPIVGPNMAKYGQKWQIWQIWLSSSLGISYVKIKTIVQHLTNHISHYPPCSIAYIIQEKNRPTR